MVQVTMDQILNLGGLINQLGNMKLPLQSSYKLVKIHSELQDEIEFYRKGFQDILEEFGDKDENGDFIMVYEKDEDGNDIESTSSIKIKDGMVEECGQKLDELRNITVEFNNQNLTLNDLEGIELDLVQMETFLPFLSEE